MSQDTPESGLPGYRPGGLIPLGGDALGAPGSRDRVLNFLESLAAKYRREPQIVSFASESTRQVEFDQSLTPEQLTGVLQQAMEYDLGMELLRAARTGDAKRVEELRGQNAPINFRDPRTGATPLHYVAAYRARPAFRALTAGAECDYLIRDGKGRLAWELAVDVDDAAMARLLVYRTRKQAEAQGVPFPPRRQAAEG